MKILHIAPIGHHSEGIGEVLQKLSPLQKSLGNDVKVVSIFENKIYENFHIITLNKKKEFLEFISKWLPDIVIFHSHYHFEYVIFSGILKRYQIPYCVQLHGALSKSNYKKNHILKAVAGCLILNRILKGAVSIIYLNKKEYENSIVPTINPNFSIIPNGCDGNKYYNNNHVVNTPVKIVYIGRISIEHKGLDILLDAIDIIQKENCNKFHIFFYGNPSDDGVPELKRRLEKCSIASYEGGVYGKDKEKLLKEADVFILTSRYEGMPMGVLEAWSYGIPCILTEGTNMIDDNMDSKAYWKAELCSNNIASTIISSVNLYINNPSLYRNAALLESKKYDWNHISEQSISLYESMIKDYTF